MVCMVTLVSFLQCVCGRRRRIGDVIEQPYQEDNSTHTYIYYEVSKSRRRMCPARTLIIRVIEQLYHTNLHL